MLVWALPLCGALINKSFFKRLSIRFKNHREPSVMMQKAVRQALILAVGLLLSFMATAQSSTDDEYSARYNKCMDASGGVTVNMLNCIADEIAAQDARLNTAYSDARSELSEERREALLAAQRLWISYRDANCNFYATAGGTLAQVVSNECFLRETTQRATELENMVGW